MAEIRLPTRPKHMSPDEIKSLQRQRETVLNEMADMPSTIQYEQESHFTPRWICPCGRENECAVTNCNGCNDTRPEILHGDPFQGDSFLGLARRIARDPNFYKIPDEAYKHAETWRSRDHHHLVREYSFSTGSEQLDWKSYTNFLLAGGQVE